MTFDLSSGTELSLPMQATDRLLVARGAAPFALQFTNLSLPVKQLNSSAGTEGQVLALVSGIWTPTTLMGSYTLPPGTSSTLGGVKQGSGLNISLDGTISLLSVPITALAQGGAANGQLLGWSGNNWAPVTAAAGTNYTGTGAISISAGAISVAAFSATVPGIVPLSGGGTTNFLRADGTWAAPGGGNSSGPTAFGTPQILTASGAIVTSNALVILNNTTTAIAATLGNGTVDGQDLEVVVLPSTAQHTIAGVFFEASQSLAANSPNTGVSLHLKWSVNRTSWYPRSYDGGYKATDYAAAASVAGMDLVSVNQGGTDRSAPAALFAAPVFAAGGVVGKAVSFTPIALIDGVTISTDASSGNEFSAVLGATGRTMANPSNLPAGKVQYFSYALSGVGTVTAWGNLFDWGAAGAPIDTANTLRNVHCRWDGTRIEALYKGAW